MSGYYSLDPDGIAGGYIEMERRREAERQRLFKSAECIKHIRQARPHHGQLLSLERVPAIAFREACEGCGWPAF